MKPLLSGVITICIATAIANSVAAQEQIGRFQIVINPQVRADTFLLDTVTGQVWQLVKFTDVNGEPVVWDYMTRFDTFQEADAFFKSRGMKPTSRPIAKR